MNRQPEAGRKLSRGLLTPAQREFLRGERDVENPDSYRYNVRSDFRGRMDKLEEDLELLREHGEDDLVEEFYDRFGRVERLERELDELREQLDGSES